MTNHEREMRKIRRVLSSKFADDCQLLFRFADWDYMLQTLAGLLDDSWAAEDLWEWFKEAKRLSKIHNDEIMRGHGPSKYSWERKVNQQIDNQLEIFERDNKQ